MSLLTFISDIVAFIYLRYKGVETNFKDVKLVGLPVIFKTKGSRIVLGKGVVLISSSKNNVAGINHPVILATMTNTSQIVIGNNTGLSGTSVVAVKGVLIGENTGLGANTNKYDTDFHLTDALLRKRQKSIEEASSSPIVIGDSVWIAGNVTVLKGVSVGDRSVIGYGSIVTKDVQQDSLCVGVPAKKIKNLI